MRLFSASRAAALLCSFTMLANIASVSAQTLPAAPATIVGSVVDQNGGLAVSNAAVELDRDQTRVATTRTDRSGSFTFVNQSAGLYTVVITANGFAASRSDTVVVVAGQTVSVRLAVARASIGSGANLREIGRVSATTTRGALQTTTTIIREVAPELLQREGYQRVGEALGTLPGVNLHNTSAALGDDIQVDIRGLKQSESQTLLDGHPLGPIGVTANQSGRYDGFNFQDSPLFALRNVQVTFGSGATGLYGTDSVGGTIDLQTLNPTRSREVRYEQGVGDLGKLSSSFSTTGTIDKLGYVLLHGVQGSYGYFQGSPIAQTGTRSNGDFTSATYAGFAYAVTGNYALRNDLGKFQYSFSPATSLTFTGYSATSADDKTGNGDNDFVTYENALATAQGKLGGTCPADLVAAQTDANPNACLTPSAWARLASGPAGGGPGAYQTIRNQDYHARLSTNLKNNQFIVDDFIDSYALDYTRQPSQIQGNLFLQSRYSRTNGFLVSDDIVTNTNDLGFGFYTQQYRVRGGQSSQDGTTFISPPDQTRNNNNYFVRDVFSATPQLQVFLNAWYRNSSLKGANSFDPRLSLVFRPTSNDVVRLTGGKSDGEPAPAFGAIALTAPGALTPNCGQSGVNGVKQFTVGSVANPSLTPEKATDIEIAYGHRFSADTAINATLYDTNETDRILAFAVPSSPFLGQFDPTQYVNVVNNACGAGTISNNPSDPNYFGRALLVNTSLNAARARSRGLEVTGRLRVNPNFFIDGAYDVQQVAVYDIPKTALVNNLTLVDGGQLVNIPMHKATVGLNYRTDSGFEAHVDGIYTSVNNPQNLPGLTQFNASFGQIVSKFTSFNLGIQNLFSTHADTYGRIGYGIFQPQNRFGGDAGNPITQGSERFGLTPFTFTFSLRQRIPY